MAPLVSTVRHQLPMARLAVSQSRPPPPLRTFNLLSPSSDAITPTPSKKMRTTTGSAPTVHNHVTTTPTTTTSSSSPSVLTESLVRAEFADSPRQTVTELTKRLTRSMAPHPIDKATLIAILKRVCELDPTTKQLALKQPINPATPLNTTTTTTKSS